LIQEDLMNKSGTLFFKMKVLITTAILCAVFMWPGCNSDSSEGGVEKTNNVLKMDNVKKMDNAEKTTLVPPQAKKVEKVLTLHGNSRIDNYFWMNQRDNPEVRAYIKAENDYVRTYLRHTAALRGKLFKEIIDRIKQVDSSVPVLYNGYYYYHRFEAGREYRIYCRKRNLEGAKEEVLFDVNQLAEGHAFFSLQETFSISGDNNYVAYGVDTISRRKYTLYVKDLRNGTLLPETIPNTGGTPVWANDGKTFFYTLKDDTLREYKILYHQLGTPVSRDRVVYHEKDPAYYVTLEKSLSEKYIMFTCISSLATQVFAVDADNHRLPPRALFAREKEHEYYAQHHEGRWLIRSNRNAPNYKLMALPVSASGDVTSTSIQEIVPHRDDVLIENFVVFKDYLVVKERREGMQLLRVINFAGGNDHYITFDDPTYAVFASANRTYDSKTFRYTYSSLTTPLTVYQFHLGSHERDRLKQQAIGNGFQSSNYQSQWIWATADDGTRIPISLVYKKSLKKDTGNPLLLYAYGAYGLSSDAEFNMQVLSLLDRGFIYSVAHVRGGMELGRHWYEEGKMMKKKNTFTDFIACARHLINEKYAQPDKLFARGGSAGGLLMGAILNMRPDLFNGVVANVPFVDVITTMLDKSIPLTTSEFNEWGNPENKEHFDYMLSYSPYDNVAAKNYPPLLVTSGLYDSQVQYFEPTKWVARLRSKKTDNNPLLLYTDMSGGHDGATGRFNKFRETALTYAFILDLCGIKE